MRGGARARLWPQAAYDAGRSGVSAGTNTRLGIALMIAVSVVFAAQDGISRHLADGYNVFMVVMIRYWFFAAFVITIASRKAGGVRAAARTEQPVLQAFRGLLLAAEICVMVTAFTVLGLVESHAIFAAYPLLVAADLDTDDRLLLPDATPEPRLSRPSSGLYARVSGERFFASLSASWPLMPGKSWAQMITSIGVMPRVVSASVPDAAICTENSSPNWRAQGSMSAGSGCRNITCFLN